MCVVEYRQTIRLPFTSCFQKYLQTHDTNIGLCIGRQ